MKTYSSKPNEVEKKWYLIDAEGLVLGRVASIAAKMVRGKHKPTFTPHIDCGDCVVIINADKIYMTGKKESEKTYFKHTGHPGGLKEDKAFKILGGEHPHRVLEKAIKRMLPKGILGREQFAKNLRIYAGTEHPHTAQQPEVLDVAAMNPKNARRGNK